MSPNTISSQVPIVITQGANTSTFDKIMIAGVTSGQQANGSVPAQVSFRYCKVDEAGNVVMAPIPGKSFAVKDLMLDPEMASACGMFFQKLVAMAFAAGAIK